MRRATVTEVKNGPSAPPARVRAGEAIEITDGGIRRERAGVIRRGGGTVPGWILDGPPPDIGGGVETIIEERRAGR